MTSPPGRLERCGDALARVVERGLAYLFLAAVALNFANVVDRYVFGHAMLSADELQVFALVFMVFLGAAVVTWRRGHLRMDVLIEACPARLRTVVRAIEALVFVVLAGFVAWQSALYVRDMYRLGRASDMAGVPMWIPHAAVAVGFTLMLLALAARGAAVRRRRPADGEHA